MDGSIIRYEGKAPPVIKKESTDDAPGEGRKNDKGKAPIFKGLLASFPLAASSIAELSAWGATKYSWDNWRDVPNGVERYSDAMVRHLVEEGKGEGVDPDSGFLHATHAAWNALARLELMLMEKNNSED